MAEVKPYILPRSLLKGFASRIVDKAVFTFLYRKGVKDVETLILNNSELVKEQLENASRYIPALNLFKGILQLEPSALGTFLNKYKSLTEMALQTFITKYKSRLLEKLKESHSSVLAKKTV